MSQVILPPATLRVEVRRPDTQGVETLEIPLSRSLPADATVALVTDLIALGKLVVSPYRLLMRQLDDLADLAEAEPNDKRRRQRLADRQQLISELGSSIQAGTADAGAEESYIEAGRATCDGLKREIVLRAKHAGLELLPAEVYAVIVPGNAAKILADLKRALNEGPPVTLPQPGVSG